MAKEASGRRSRRLRLASGMALFIVLVAGLGFNSRLQPDVERVVQIFRARGINGVYVKVMQQIGLEPPGMRFASASPDAEGMDGARLDALQANLARLHTTAFLVIRHDHIVHEWYAPGVGPMDRHYTAALAKGLIGGVALMVALNDHRLSLTDPAWKYIPSWKHDSLKSKITIRELATFTSGLDDIDFNRPQTGWRQTYVQDRATRFRFALDRTPVIFEPGTETKYSGIGFYALAYALTASLQGTPQPDIQTLLRARVMDPIGIPLDAWSISYGESYRMNGMTLYAMGSGGEYTPRAIARVGQFLLHHGAWDGRQLVSPAWVDSMTTYSGVPNPDRTTDPAVPAMGIGWYTNTDGAWSSVPRDAFGAAGDGQQVLLVVPSLDLVMVRMGEELADEATDGRFWGPIDTELFEPLMASIVRPRNVMADR